MPYPLADCVLYFFIYSFLGWLMETVQDTVRKKHFVNRGFLTGPICPIYGCGVLLMLILLLPVRDRISAPAVALPVIFLAGAAIASIVEYVTSWAMEKLFHARWWDYSHMRFNLGGRICLWISLAWGALATGLLYFVQPLFERLIHSLYSASSLLPAILAAVLSALLAVDTVISAKVARAVGNKLEQMDQLAALIRAHLEEMERPSAEGLALRLEDLYDRYTGWYKEKMTLWKQQAAEWRALSPEELRRRLANRAAELKAARAGLLRSRGLMRRLMRAFPTLKSRSGTSVCAEWRESDKKDEPRQNRRSRFAAFSTAVRRPFGQRTAFCRAAACKRPGFPARRQNSRRVPPLSATHTKCGRLIGCNKIILWGSRCYE